VAARGRPKVPKPDQEWWAGELAQLENEAAHFRTIGSALLPLVESEIAELRAIIGRKWRGDKPLEMWAQRGRGMIHAGTYDPVAARHLALRLALADLRALRASVDPGESIDPESKLYKNAQLSCNEAADTWGNPRSKRALWAIIEACKEAAFPERVGRLAAPEVLVLELATGVSLDTILSVLRPRC